MAKSFLLIVEEEQLCIKVYARITSEYFKDFGSTVETIFVQSAQDALKIAQVKHESEPEVEWGLLTDYHLMDLNGSQLIDQLTIVLGDKLIWKLVLSGSPDIDFYQKELDARQAFLDQKPLGKFDVESWLFRFLTSLS